MALKTKSARRTEARDLEDTATKVVTFFVVTGVGVIVLNEFWGAIDTTSGPYSDVFTTIEDMVSSVFGLLVILPLVLVAAIAYNMLSDEM